MEQKQYPTIDMNAHSGGSLRFLYENAFGRLFLKLLISPFVSKLGGVYLSSPLSRPMIASFIKKNQIDMHQYEKGPFASFNDFFKRKMADGVRPSYEDPGLLLAPCDGKLSAYPITEDCCFSIKGFCYSIHDLLLDEGLASSFLGGICLVFRLMPDDYHRYHYIDDGEILSYRKIPGVLHTVRPIALNKFNVFGQNTREYALIKTAHMGHMVQMEVGALFVGRISNHKRSGIVKRGEEKGTFEFGGSTVVMLFEKNSVIVDPILFQNTAEDKESIVKMGEPIGSYSS